MREKLSSGFPTTSDINWVIQPLKMARDLKFRNKEVEGLHYLGSKNKGADQLCGYCIADLGLCFRVYMYAKIRFSHYTPQITLRSDIIIT